MSRFAIRYPYLIIVLCLVIGVVGTSSLVRMPVDLFPPINIPVVVVATFYSGMPPEDIENDITGTYERFFTLASGIDHIQSRSLPGVSLIKVFFTLVQMRILMSRRFPISRWRICGVYHPGRCLLSF